MFRICCFCWLWLLSQLKLNYADDLFLLATLAPEWQRHHQNNFMRKCLFIYFLKNAPVYTLEDNPKPPEQEDA